MKEKKTLKKITALAERIVRQAKSQKNPTVQIPIRTLANVSFNEKKSIIELGDDVQERQFFNDH